MWDLEFFHLLAAAVNVVTVLFASVLVVAMTRTDGNVGVSVGFVAVFVATFLIIRGAARLGLAAAERRVAATAALEARVALLDAMSRGATVAPGAASAFVATSADQIGAFVARAVPARTTAWLVAVGTLCIEAIVDGWSGLIAFGVLCVVPVVMVAVGRRAQRDAATSLSRLRSLATRALELLDGAVELRALGALARGRDELGAATDRAVASTRASLRLALRSASALDLLAGVAVGLVAMADGFRLLDGGMSLGHALAAVLLTVEVFAPLRAAGAAFHAGADGRAALALLDATSALATRPGGVDLEVPAPIPAISTTPAVTAIGASLLAAPGAPVVLRAISFTVPPAGSLVVEGPTGSGKSTLLRAIAGAPLVADGSLRLDDVEASAVPLSERVAQLALVAQRPFLVAGTVRENLELGRRSSDAEIDDVVGRCGLRTLLGRSPRGLDEEVGEQGRLLSAGERTRVALARAVLRQPGVLLLDEVGAHLDDTALEELRRSLDSFLHARTVIEVAHERPLLLGVPVLRLAELVGTS
jgi:ABC-type transport system involved in cytochrome bd biosynthesis fused ATPase/permease subunit